MTEPSPPNEPDSRELALLVGTMFGVALLVDISGVTRVAGPRAGL